MFYTVNPAIAMILRCTPSRLLRQLFSKRAPKGRLTGGKGCAPCAVQGHRATALIYLPLALLHANTDLIASFVKKAAMLHNKPVGPHSLVAFTTTQHDSHKPACTTRALHQQCHQTYKLHVGTVPHSHIMPHPHFVPQTQRRRTSHTRQSLQGWLAWHPGPHTRWQAPAQHHPCAGSAGQAAEQLAAAGWPDLGLPFCHKSRSAHCTEALQAMTDAPLVEHNPC